LSPDAPLWTEGSSEGFVNHFDSEGVEIALRLANNQLARKQLQALSGLKDPLIDEAVIFDARPAAGARVCRLHGF
jgi:hypothetical protein